MSPDPMPDTAAVLTGDLIGSTKAAPSALEQAMDLLAEAAAEVTDWTQRPSRPDARFTRFRGDGWQMLVAEPGLALRAALVLAARLRAADLDLATRTAIGIGGIDSLGKSSLAEARGSAFEASGRTLDHMGRTHRLAIDGDGITSFHRIILDLLDQLATHWTRQQAEATALYLQPDNPTLEQIAPAARHLRPGRQLPAVGSGGTGDPPGAADLGGRLRGQRHRGGRRRMTPLSRPSRPGGCDA